MSFPVRVHFFPVLGVFAIGIFIGIVAAALIVIPKLQTDIDTARQNYGNALAKMAAHQAADATSNHDLVRLQVVLRDIIENPLTTMATIHDVENNLLVQAGKVSKAPHDDFTLPIVVYDSVAGYVTITLDKRNHSTLPMLILIGLTLTGLLAIFAWSFVSTGAVTWHWPPFKSDNNLTTANDEAELPSAEPEPEPVKVFAIVHVKNMQVLKQQLTGETFRSTFNRMEKIMSDVLALYSGSGFDFHDNYYTLVFNASDATNEALFRATCSAHLIIELASIINNIPLDLAAFVSANSEDVTPKSLPFAGLIMESTAASDELIQRRLQFMELGTDDGRFVVAGFMQPFQNLLNNQCRQLAQLI